MLEFGYIVALALAGELPTGPASFRALGDTPGGIFYSRADAVSSDGSVVVGSCADGSAIRVPYRWTKATGIVPLGHLPGGPVDDGGWSFGVSADGTIVVGQSGREAYRWTASTGLTGIGDLPGGEFNSAAESISADGVVIVGRSHGPDGHEAFRWTQSDGMIGLGQLPSDWQHISGAEAVSGDGSIIYGYSHSFDVSYLCRWVGSGPIENLGAAFDGGAMTLGIDVSADGGAVCGWADDGSPSPGSQAYLWTESVGFVGLGFLPDSWQDSEAHAISGDGTIVVGHDVIGTPPGDNNEAMVWTEATGMLDLRLWLESEHGLKLDGWILERAEDISDDGTTIVGYGTDPCGNTQAWMVRLAPPVLEPASPCPGDVNGDRAVDFADLNDLLARFNTEAICADLDGDGQVGFPDLNLVLSNFSALCSPG